MEEAGAPRPCPSSPTLSILRRWNSFGASVQTIIRITAMSAFSDLRRIPSGTRAGAGSRPGGLSGRTTQPFAVGMALTGRMADGFGSEA